MFSNTKTFQNDIQNFVKMRYKIYILHHSIIYCYISILLKILIHLIVLNNISINSQFVKIYILVLELIGCDYASS